MVLITAVLLLFGYNISWVVLFGQECSSVNLQQGCKLRYTRVVVEQYLGRRALGAGEGYI
jgi:hypothetical protein